MVVPMFPSPPGNWGGETSPWGSYSATGTVTSAAVTLGAVGWYQVVTGAHNTVQAIPVVGTTTITLCPASSSEFIYSDGAVLIINDGTGGTAAHYAQLLGNT